MKRTENLGIPSTPTRRHPQVQGNGSGLRLSSNPHTLEGGGTKEVQNNTSVTKNYMWSHEQSETIVKGGYA